MSFPSTAYKIEADWHIAAAQVVAWQQAGLQVVFTNGCFDILHQGHVDYLEASRAKGDKMVLGLNTDRSVSKNKGPLRPVVPQEARARVLAALACIDLIVFFEEETPLELITKLAPDILTKGADYSLDTIVGADFVLNNGGRVETVSLVEGFSTTNIINKIKQAY
jgi:rfaE bifunctional protein nucleotidyltransferase chain/domain